VTTTDDAPACPRGRSGRAAPLTPDDRRAQILTSVVPLIRERGVDVSTRELADAAGVAEGTLFRVFPDKTALLVAAVRHAIELATAPGPGRRELLEIDRTLPLEERLSRVIAVSNARMSAIVELMGLMRSIVMRHPELAEGAPDHAARHARLQEGHAFLVETITEVIGPDLPRLRIPVDRVVDLMQTLVVAGQLPWIGSHPPLDPAEVAAVLVRGVLTDRGTP